MKGKTLKQITNTSKAGLKEIPSLPSNEDFTIDLISKQSSKVYKINVNELNSGTGDGIQSIQEGTNITVDNTDPLNPIVNASGGGVLSGLTAATASNTINNTDKQQEWQWNSLSSGIGLKLSSSSTAAASGTQTLFEVNNSGANATSGQTTYTSKFISNKTGTSSVSYAIYAECINSAVNTAGYFKATGGTVNIAISCNGRIDLSPTAVPTIVFGNGAFIDTDGIGANIMRIVPSSSGGLMLRTFTGQYGGFTIVDPSSSYLSAFNFHSVSVNRHIMSFGGDYFSGYRPLSTSAAVIEQDADKLIISANSGLAGSYTLYTPNKQLTIYGTNNNVGIGSTTPVASAKLEIVSTTQGFLPPRMTATQASAISSPAQGLMLFVTDTNGTFTGVGWWGYNGANWEKLNN